MLLTLSWALYLLSLSCITVHASQHERNLATSGFTDLPNRAGPEQRDEPIIHRVSCEIGDSPPKRRNIWNAELSGSIAPRAPSHAQPLQEPKSYSDDDFAKFMGGFVMRRPMAGRQILEISPDPSQYESWKIVYGNQNIPIGATGVWFPFEGEKKSFTMQGLTGCTGIIVVSSKGIWAGHLWEGSTAINGASSFTHRYGLGENEVRVRGQSEFKTVAVDIFGRATSRRDKPKRPLWKSLEDVRQEANNPFGDGTDTEVFLLTKANSPDDYSMMYPKSIKLLRDKFNQLIPGSRYQERTYAWDDASIPLPIRGVIGVQYTPYDHDGDDKDCSPQARVRLFYTNKKQPIIDKSWKAHGPQVAAKNKRDACGKRGSWPIKRGYVAFGDSYAAGMGTGTTSWDGCRIGTANVGDLIHAYTNKSDIDYQRKMCSGDTTVGLNRQIDEWSNPERADIATVTAGGNDVGFTDILWYCVLAVDAHIILWHFPSYYKKYCNEVKEKGRRMMEDSSENGLKAKLVAAYKKMLEKSKREDFHIYVSGYPSGFWNTEDIQPVNCKDTIFNWPTAAYCPHWYQECYSNTNIYLTVELRQDLNGLVVQLNQLINAAVEQVNSATKHSQVHFVDVGPFYDTHRWCEKMDDPESHEPAENRADTWFFLSGWKDIDPSGAASALQEDPNHGEDQEVIALAKQGSVQLPPFDKCEGNLGTDPDPYARFMCRVSQVVHMAPNGTVAAGLKEANNQIASNNLTAQHIKWYIPTRQIKTFHPRTPGMIAYRDSIINAIRGIQVNSISPSAPPGPKSTTVSPTPKPLPPPPPPPPQPTLGRLQCHEAFKGHKDVHADGQTSSAEEICIKADGHMIKADDPGTNIHFEPVEFSDYKYDVYWTTGCKGESINAGKPLTDRPDTCASLLKDAYKNCYNGGAGGKIQAGCLTYEFSVSKKE